MPTASLRDFCEALAIMAEIIVPQPDPTLLTTAQLTREISNARELIESKVSGAVLMLEGLIAANASALETVRIMVDRHVDTSIRDVKEFWKLVLSEWTEQSTFCRIYKIAFR
jgi:hypothetical protein